MTFIKTWTRIVGDYILTAGILLACGIILTIAVKMIIASRYAVWIVCSMLLLAFIIGTLLEAVGASYKPTDHISE